MSYSTKSIPVLSMVELQKVWSTLTAADRAAILGHSSEELSREDSARLMKVLARVKTTSTV